MTRPMNRDTILTGLVTGTMSTNRSSRMSAGGTLSGVRSSACFHAAFLLGSAMTKERFMTGMGDLYEVEPNTGCWLWTRGVRDDYGNVWIDSLNQQAHRVMWEITYGLIPEGMNVLHRCDTPPCINPAHLWLGTQSDNINDMVKKGRGHVWRGAANGNAVLTENDVVNIRHLLSEGTPYNTVARQFGVGRSTVVAIDIGRSWKWL